MVDTAIIATSFAVEETNLQTLLDAPTTDLVNQLLGILTAKAQEFDDAKAEKLRSDVELENTVRNSDNRVKGLKSTVNKGLKEIEDLRKNLSTQGEPERAMDTVQH